MKQTPSSDPIQQHNQLQQDLARLSERRRAATDEINARQAEAAKAKAVTARPTVAELLSDTIELAEAPNHSGRIAELNRLIRHIDEASTDIRRQMVDTARAASIDTIKGPAGDKWRLAVKQLHKAVKDLAAADALVEQEHRALEAQLKDPDALALIRFPAGFRHVSPGDARVMVDEFEQVIQSADRRYA